MQPLKQSTATEVTIGPAVAVGDGFTPITNLTIAGADEKAVIKHNASTSVTLTGTLAAFTAAVDGYYHLDLSTGDTDTLGRLTLVIQDDSLILPIRQEFVVLPANVFDSLYGADILQVDQRQIVGTTVPTPSTAGIPDVNVQEWLDGTPVSMISGRINVSVGSMQGSVLNAGALVADACNKIADHTIRRTFANAQASANGDTKTFRSLLGAIAKLVNKVSITGSTLTVTEEDDIASLGTQTVTTDAAADPITAVDTV